MRGITIYSKNSGMEILANDKEKKNNKYGVITLRFFKLDGSGVLKFIMTPIESFCVSNFVKALITSTSSAKKTLTHKFNKNNSETTSFLIFEKWEKNGKMGYAVSIKRDSVSINVPMDTNTFYYLSELFRYLSVQQAWVNPIEQQPTDENGTATDTEIPIDTDIVIKDYEEEIADTNDEINTSENITEPELVKGTTIQGIIDAIRKDQKGFKVGEKWFVLNSNSQIQTKLEKGKKVTIAFVTDKNINYANLITA